MLKRSIQVVILLALITGIIYFLNDHLYSQLAYFTSILTTLTVVFVAAVIFMENRNPTSTMAWLLILALVPVLGFVFYLLFGQNYRKRRKFNRKALKDARLSLTLRNQFARESDEIRHFPPHRRKVTLLSRKVSKIPLSFATDTRVLTDGTETFAAILKALWQATHHIHMEYYIYRDDEIGRQIKDILIAKAKEGVHVRFLYDAVGSYKLPLAFIHALKDAGVETQAFDPVSFPLLSSKVNFRNHRKIIVIDGSVGFIGGLNVGDEYLSRDKNIGYWRDTHLQVKGEAVRTLQFIFMTDWHHMTGQTYFTHDYFSPALIDHADGGVQIIASGPDQEWKTMKKLFFAMITSAEKSIKIATPYFIPDEDILTALHVASMSGVHVQLLFPKKPDRWIPYFASHSYFPDLLEAGVSIHEYERGFMHAKILIVDDEIASIGTANMDMRSFHLNFEVNAFLYGTQSVKRLVEDFEADLEHAPMIDKKRFAKKRYGVRMLESAARLMSPLL